MTNYVIVRKNTSRYHTSAFCQALDPIYLKPGDRVKQVGDSEINNRKLRLCQICKKYEDGE